MSNAINAADVPFMVESNKLSWVKNAIPTAILICSYQRELAEECLRQSLLLKGDPQENEILKYIESVKDTQ